MLGTFTYEVIEAEFVRLKYFVPLPSLITTGGGRVFQLASTNVAALKFEGDDGTDSRYRFQTSKILCEYRNSQQQYRSHSLLL